MRDRTPEYGRVFLQALERFALCGAYLIPLTHAQILESFTDYRPAHDLLILPMQVAELPVGLMAIESSGPTNAESVQLLRAYANLVATLCDRERRIASLAHDVKGPLTVIMGYCELLLESPTAERAELETIFSQAKRLDQAAETALISAQRPPSRI